MVNANVRATKHQPETRVQNGFRSETIIAETGISKPKK